MMQEKQSQQKQGGEQPAESPLAALVAPKPTSGRKGPARLSQGQIEAELYSHFGRAGSCENLLELHGNQITAAVAKKWIEMPLVAANKMREEAENKSDPDQKKAAIARATDIGTVVELNLRAIKNMQGDLTPGNVDSLYSPFWKNVTKMAVASVISYSASVALGAACLGGYLAVAPGLSLIGACLVANKICSWWYKRQCDHDFDSTVKRAFSDALEGGDSPVKQVVYTAVLAYMVQRWKSRALIWTDSLDRTSPDKDNLLPTGMAYLENAIKYAMGSLYGQCNGTKQALKDPLFDQSLKKFEPFLDKLKNRWGAAPTVLDVVAGGTATIGLVVGGMALINWLSPLLG